MRILKSGLVLFSASLLLAATAQATTFEGNAGAGSHFSISIGADGLGTTSGSGAITGSATADLTTLGSGAVQVNSGSGSFKVANFTTTPPLTALGSTTIEDFAFTTTLAAVTSSNTSNPFTINLGGSKIDVDAGYVIQTSTGMTLFNFATSPLVVTVPSPAPTTLNTATGVWTIPFTTTSTLSTQGIPIDITIATNLVIEAIPEPGTLLLLGAGVTGLLVASRRKKA
jgi:hypothetical protein